MNMFLRDVTFVHGTDIHAAPRQTRALATDDVRFAVVLNSICPESPDALFDFELYEEMVLGAIGFLAPMLVRITFDEGDIYSWLEEATQRIAALSPVDREPPRLIELTLAGERHFVVEAEDWVRFGGPMPYHDSYTFVAYAEPRIVERFAEYCRKVALTRRIQFVDVYANLV